MNKTMMTLAVVGTCLALPALADGKHVVRTSTYSSEETRTVGYSTVNHKDLMSESPPGFSIVTHKRCDDERPQAV